MSYSPPGFSIHGIFQAGILEQYTAISFSRGSPQPRDQSLCLLHWQGVSLPAELPVKTYGLNFHPSPTPNIHMSKPYAPCLLNVTVFGDRAFKDVMKLKRSQASTVSPNPI